MYRQLIATQLWGFALVATCAGAVNLPAVPLFSAALTLTIAAALMLLVVPHRPTLLVVSAVTFLAFLVTALPALPNHRVVLGFVAVAILVTARGRGSIDRFSATLRWATLIVYGYAAFAKFNTAYLDPTVSCATVFLRQTLGGYGLASASAYPGWFEYAPIVWSIGSELALLGLLVAPRTRLYGVAFGLLFHLLLAADYVKFFGNFSAAMSLLLLASLGEDHARWLWHRAPGFWRVVLPGAAIGLAVVTVAGIVETLNITTIIVLRQILVYTALGGLTGYVIALLRARRSLTPPGAIGRPYIALVCLLVLNGAAPYLGLKTRSALTMYSNLRIESDYSNHLIAPPSADILGLLADRVTILSTDDLALRAYLETASHTITYAELCTYLEWRGDIPAAEGATEAALTYERRGLVSSTRRGAALPTDCPSIIIRRTTLFGPLGAGSERACLW